MKNQKKYKKRGLAAVLVAAAFIMSLMAPQILTSAATERVKLLIAPKTVIGGSKGDYVGWTEFSSGDVQEYEEGNITGAWYTQKIASTGREWEDYAVYNNQNSSDISGYLWEAAYLKDPGISLKMGVDNTFRHRVTSESLKAANGKVEHDCLFARKTISAAYNPEEIHPDCDVCVKDTGKYDWSMVPTKEINKDTGEREENYSFYFEDNDTAGLFLNGVVKEVAVKTSNGNYKQQYYTGFVLYLNESPSSASYNSERQMESGIYYCINSRFSTTSYRDGGYMKASDVKSGKSGVYQLKTFSDALEEKGLVTFGVSKGEEGRDSNIADDNYSDVSFESSLKNGKVTVTAKVVNDKTGVNTSLSFTGDAAYYRSEGSVGFFSYSQPCATFAEIKVSGIPPEFTITYDADGGKFADGTTADKKQLVELYDFEYVDSIEYAFPVPIGIFKGQTVSRTGYHIKDNYNTPSKSNGWYYNLYEDDEIELLSTMYYTDYFHEDITVKPAWEPNQLTVKYNVNGGTGTIDNTVMKYDKSYKLTSTAPTREGYVFKGWSLKKNPASSDTLYTNSSTKQTAQAWASTFGKSIDTKNASVTLYAQWEIAGRVQYHSNSGTATAKSGYTLVDMVTDIGGLAGNSSGTVIKKSISETDTTANLHNVGTLFSRTGYHAKAGEEWLIGSNTGTPVSQADNTDMTNVINAIKNNSDRLVTLYANWEANSYIIKFDGNGATSGTMADMSMIYNVAKKLTPNDYQNLGHTFTGWNTKADGSGDSYTDMQSVINLTSEDGGTVTLYAQWKSNEYTIRFDGNGSTSGSMSDMKMTYNVAKNLSPNQYSRIGYEFVNWNTKADGTGESFENEQSVINLTAVPNGVITLYAQWKPITYTIRFNANGGVGHMDDITPVFYDEEIELPECVFTKENEYGPSGFKGWNLIGDTKDILYEDKATVKNLTEEKDAVVTLYAIWDDCPGIEAKDLYYTLMQAQSGYITEDELLSHAKAFDLEDNEIQPGTHETNSFRVMDYQASDFTQFQHSGSVTETYKVIDSFGNTYQERITVYIVDTGSDPIKTTSSHTEKEGTTRFIDEKYFSLPYEQGGLEANSIWLVDTEYKQALLRGFDNLKNDTPIAVYEFTYEEILEMKEFVNTNGIGNTKYPDALNRFYEKFMR